MGTLQPIDPRIKDIGNLLAAEANETIGPKSKKILAQLRETGEVPPNLRLKTGFAEGLTQEQFAIISTLLEATKVPGGGTEAELAPVVAEIVKQNPQLFEVSIIDPFPKLKVQPGRAGPFEPRGKTLTQRMREEAPTAIGATLPFLLPGGMARGILSRVGLAAVGGAGGKGAQLLATNPELSRFERALTIGEAGAVEGLLESVLAGAGTGFRALREARAGIGRFRLKPSITQRTLASKTIRRAEELGLELDIAQATAEGAESEFMSNIRSVIGRALFTAKPFRRQEIRKNEALVNLLRNFSRNISSGRFNRREIGVATGEMVRIILQEAGQNLGKVQDQIAKDFPVDVVEQISKRPSVVLTTAGKPFTVTTKKTLKGKFVDFGKRESNIRNLLKEAQDIEAAAGPPPGVKSTIKSVEDVLFPADQPLLIGEAFQAAKNLRLQSKAKRGNLGRILAEARIELLSSVADNLKAKRLRGGDELFTALSRYKELIRSVETPLIRSLARLKAPESLGFMLANKQRGLTRAETLKAIFLEQGKTGSLPEPIRRSFVEAIIDKSLTEGVLTGNSLENAVKGIGEDTVRTVLTKEEADFLLKDIQGFANILNIRPELTKPLSAIDPTLLAFGQSAGTAESVRRGKILTAISILGIPAVAARILTSRSGPELLRKWAAARAVGANLGPKLLLRMVAAGLGTQDQPAK